MLWDIRFKLWDVRSRPWDIHPKDWDKTFTTEKELSHHCPRTISV